MGAEALEPSAVTNEGIAMPASPHQERTTRPRVWWRTLPRVPRRPTLAIERQVRIKITRTAVLVVVTGGLAVLLAVVWGELASIGWDPKPSSNWDDVGFLAGMGGLSVTLFVATQIDSVSHWATAPDAVAQRIILEGVTSYTLLATAVGAWLVLAQGVLANELSLAPSAFLIWIALVFCALSQVARPSPTASRRSLEQNEHDQRRLRILQTELDRQIVALRTVPEAWVLICMSGAVAGLAAGGALWVVTAIASRPQPDVVILGASSIVYGAASCVVTTYLLRPMSVRKFVQSRLVRASDALSIVIMAALVAFVMAGAVKLVPGDLGATLAAAIGILWLAPMLTHLLFVSRSASYLVLRLNTVRSQLTQLANSRNDLVAQAGHVARGHSHHSGGVGAETDGTCGTVGNRATTPTPTPTTGSLSGSDRSGAR